MVPTEKYEQIKNFDFGDAHFTFRKRNTIFASTAAMPP